MSAWAHERVGGRRHAPTRRSRAVVAAGFACAAWAYGLAWIVGLGGALADALGLLAVASLIAGVLGALMAPRLARCRDGYDAAQLGVAVSSAASLVLFVGVAAVGGIAALAAGEARLSNVLGPAGGGVLVLVVVASVAALPFGAVAGWASWRWLRHAP